MWCGVLRCRYVVVERIVTRMSWCVVALDVVLCRVVVRRGALHYGGVWCVVVLCGVL